jgi:hypothetical protein
MHLYLEVNVEDPYFLGADDMLGTRYDYYTHATPTLFNSGFRRNQLG